MRRIIGADVGQIRSGGVVVAPAEIAPAITRVDSQPAVASSFDELLAERVLLAVVAALAAVLVPGQAERLIHTPLKPGRISPAAATPAAMPRV